MEDVLLAALWPGRAYSDYDVVLCALISWVFMIVLKQRRKNSKGNEMYSITYFKENVLKRNNIIVNVIALC